MTSLYNNLLDFLFFYILVACIFLNLFIFFLLEVSYGFFFFFWTTLMAFLFIFTCIVSKNKTHFILKILRILSLFSIYCNFVIQFLLIFWQCLWAFFSFLPTYREKEKQKFEKIR
jgi:hypothetical protein